MRKNQPRNNRRPQSGSLGKHLFFVLVCVVSAAAAPVVPNPSFEQAQIACPPPAPFQECVSTANQAMIPGWTHSGADGEGWLWQVGYSDATGTITTAGDAMQFVTMGGGEFTSAFASWTTTVTGLNPGTAYLLAFMIASEGVNASQSLTATLSNGATATGNFTAPTSAGNYWRTWVPMSLPFTATGTSATLVFSTTTQQDIGLDAVSVTALVAIPEPGTLGLLGLGVLVVVSPPPQDLSFNQNCSFQQTFLLGNIRIPGTRCTERLSAVD